MGTSVKAVIFDLGGVLIEVDKARSHDRWREHTHLDTKAFERAFFEHGLKGRFDTGEVKEAAFLAEVRDRSGLSLPDEVIIDIWCAMLRPWPESQKVTERLSLEYTLAVLSDIDPIHRRHLERTCPFMSLFAARVYSFQENAVKPHPVLFSRVLGLLDLDAEECLFVDDKASNIEGAANAGIRTFHDTRGREGLDALLEMLG